MDSCFGTQLPLWIFSFSFDILYLHRYTWCPKHQEHSVESVRISQAICSTAEGIPCGWIPNSDLISLINFNLLLYTTSLVEPMSMSGVNYVFTSFLTPQKHKKLFFFGSKTHSKVVCNSNQEFTLVLELGLVIELTPKHSVRNQSCSITIVNPIVLILQPIEICKLSTKNLINVHNIRNFLCMLCGYFTTRIFKGGRDPLWMDTQLLT